ncbi:MAG: hypothetical protein E7115_04310 [Bacteroidales bacterium]|nr:hypothetical protein [Bacteroidales bacterium]
MKRIMKGIAGAVLAVVVSAPVFTSCYDDTELWDAVEGLDDRVTKLEADLTAQADAMSTLLKDGSTVAKCEKQADGSYLITLSDGTSFKALPQGTDFSSLMTYVEIGGSRYWAVYGPTGEAEVLLDADGKNIPVSVKVDVTVKDGRYYLVVNGIEYETCYDVEDIVQVFESCTPHTDASGKVYALTFSFGEGLDVTVSVDGYNGVLFKIENASSMTLVTDYYVPYGTTQTFLIDKEGVIEYAPIAPAGWKVVEREDKQSGNTYLDITAPSRTLVASGAAFASGDLKAVAIVEGGDATITKLTLSADPFRTLDISATRLAVEPYTGVTKYVYGVVAEEDYDEDEVLAKIEDLLVHGGDVPEGYAVAEKAVNVLVGEILSTGLNPEKRYVLFIIPALYDMDAESVYYIDPDMLVTYDFGAILTSISEPVPSLFDADVVVEVIGTDKMWAGTALKTDDLFTNIIYSIQNGILDPVTESLTYSGKASAFPTVEANEGVEFTPGTAYVTWFVPFDPEKTEYTEDDIIYKEFKTLSIAQGGSLDVVAGEAEVTSSSITFPLSAEGAEMIYYAYLTEDEGGRLAATEGMDEYKFELLQESESCTIVKADEAVATVSGLIPESTMWLYAVAVDADGKYGKVTCVSATLEKVKFNSLTVSYTNVEIGSDEIEYEISVSGGTPVRYIYWIGTLNDPFWVKCGKTRGNAEKYMAINPDDEAIARVMRANGDVSADGKIKITGLRLEEDYIMMVLAQDESGLFSKGAYKKVTTLAADLGEVRTEGSDLWNTARSSIVLDWIEESFESAASQGLMAQYAFNFSCPQDYTAYVMCASDTYFEDAGLVKMSQIMIEIENFASRKYDDGRTPMENGVPLNEPDYYKDGELRQGQMMNVYSYYVHGLPSLGFATYFAPDSHGEGNCIYWDEELGQDVNYQRALDHIAEHCTLAPYERRADAFGLSGQEKADWAQALLEAYLPYYENAEPIVLVNDGSPLTIRNPYGTGVNDKGVVPDRVIVMLKDRQGNYFEPMMFEVPDYFTK